MINRELPHTFWGYRRPDGTVGIRNHLLVVPSVICANTVAQRVAALIPGAVAVPHPHGCAQVGDDVTLTERMLAGTAANPNVGAAVVIGLGCETCQATDVAKMVRQLAPGKPVESFFIQEAGGSIKAIARGVEVGKALMAQIAPQQREEIPLSELVLATECGSLDETAEAASNPTVGAASELALDAGGTVIVSRSAERLVDGAPGRQGVLPVAERPAGAGLYVMDTPGQDEVAVTAMAAGGSQVCLFSTGRGTPMGNAICPVVKVCGNPHTLETMEDNIDFSTLDLLEGRATKDDLARRLFQLAIEVCNGQLTNAEIIGHQEFAIHRVGPTV
jgi:altronate dehydratase large subunit